jgi:putative membrane protein
MRRSISCIAGIPLLAVPALAGCSGPDRGQEQVAMAAGASQQAGTHPALSTVDSYFLDQAAQQGLMEAEISGIAQERASGAVQTLAADMVRDYTWVNDSLGKLDAAKSVTPPNTLTPSQQQTLSHLATLRGANFDRQYLDQQATAHQHVIELYRNETQQGTDPDLRAFAERVLPRLEQHQAMIEKLGGQPASG